MEGELMRKEFATELLKQAKQNDKIWLVTADLGYGLWDEFRDQIPERYLNTGASEQAAADICVGLALQDRIPFFYSITTFLLYRCFETIRTYINHEKLNVKLIGSGRNQDYHIDGFSHDATDAKKILDTLPNIHQYWPNEDTNLERLVGIMVNCNKPDFISLRR